MAGLVTHTNRVTFAPLPLFITSANLTDYAMNLNMEMGVLIRGGGMPKQVEGHFEGMITKKILVDAE